MTRRALLSELLLGFFLVSVVAAFLAAQILLA